MSGDEPDAPRGPGDPKALVDRARAELARDPRAAMRGAIAAIRAARAARDDIHELKGYWVLSGGIALRRRPRAVLAVVERALACPAALRDPVLRARTTLGRGSALIHFGRLDDVVRDAQAALVVLRKSGDLSAVAAAHGLLAEAAAGSGRHRDALRHIAEQRGVLQGRAGAFTLASIDTMEALSHAALFVFEEALRLSERAADAFDRMGAAVEAANNRYNAGYVHLRSGRLADALRAFVRASEAFETLGEAGLVAPLRVDQAELLLELGDTGEARRILSQLKEDAAEATSAKDRFRVRLMLAIAALRESDCAASLVHAALAAQSASMLTDARGVAESLVVQSMAALASGDAETAGELARHAVDRFDEAGSGPAACAADLAECRAALAAGRVRDGDDALARARARPGAEVLPWAVVDFDRHRGLVLAARGDDGGAARALDAAVRGLESRRGLLPPDAMRSSFFSMHMPLYREAIRAHLRTGAVERAFELAAASKSRALLDMMTTGARVDPRRTQELESLRTALGAAYSRLHDASFRGTAAADMSAARQDALALEARVDRIIGESLEESGNRTALTSGRAADVQSVLRDGEVLVEFAEDEQGVHAFVVDRASVRHVALDLHAGEIQTRIRRFAFHMTSAAATPDEEQSVEPVRANLDALRRALVDPLRIPDTARTVVIAPIPSLQAVPFHAFPRGSGWWADDVLVQYAPSAFVHAECVRSPRREGGATCVLAVPDALAPEVAVEARLVAAALGSSATCVIGDDVRWDRFVEAAGTARILHFATHGLSRTDSRAGASLRLADGWLTQFDLHRIRVAAELVVLSACDSGVVHTGPSGDSFGLLRGFLCAGARGLVASKWRVHDRAAAEWMSAFYAALARGLTLGAAYREAGYSLRRCRPHPFGWAAFVALGDASRDFFPGIPVSDAVHAA